MKICTKCGIAKPLAEFHKDRRIHSGLRADCKVCVTARATAWNRANADKHIAVALRWNKANPERVKEIERARQLKNPRRGTDFYRAHQERSKAASRKYRLAHPDKVKAKDAAWHRLNRDLVAAYSSTRRARKSKATPAWANRSAIDTFFTIADAKRKETGQSWHVDHIVPLKSSLVCGLHVEHNLQVIPGPENDSKGNRYWPDMP